MSFVLAYSQDVDLIVDDNRARSDLNGAVFAFNWVVFGFALAYCSNAEFVYRKTGIISSSQAGLYAASLAVGGLIGCILAGSPMRDFLGYRLCQVCASVVGAVGWILHMFLLIPLYEYSANPASSFPVLILGRVLVGVMCGISAHVIPVCVSSVASARLRHIIGILPPLALSLGFLISLISGYKFIRADVSSGVYSGFLGYLPVIGVLLSILGLLISLWFDEKLINEDWVNYTDGGNYDPLMGENANLVARYKEIFRVLRQKHVQKQLVLGCILPIQQLLGINVILFKATSIFAPFFHSRNEDISLPAMVGVLIGLVYFLSSFLVPVLSYLCRRKLILYIGSILITIIHVCFALVYFFGHGDSVLIPILGVGFIVVFCCSWGPFPWLIVSEVFDPRIRGVAMTISSSLLWVAMFGTTAMLTPILDFPSPYGVFVILSTFSVAGLVFVHFFVPETKYLSLEEIQEYFKQN